MMTRKTASLFAAAALCAASQGAQANVISIDPIGQVVDEGDTVTVMISAFFAEPTVGGSFDLFYDPMQLAFLSFEFDAHFLNDVSDPAFAHAPDNCMTGGAPFGGCNVGDAELNAIGFGNFDGISGTNLVATLTFSAIGAGTSALTMAVNDAPYGGFFSATTGLEMNVYYNSAKVVVNAVPIPAALWLLLSAIGVLGARRAR